VSSIDIHKSEKRFWWGVLFALFCAILLKTSLLIANVIPFNADEAVVGLMAKHIMQGKFPIFFYGQAYMGSLDAWLIAGGFLIFGQQVWVIRLVQMLIYLGVIVTTALIAKAISGNGRVGVIAAWLMAIPTINVTLYTTASLGGYGEALLIGNLILLLSLRIATSGFDHRFWNWLILGFFYGLGFWAFGYTLVYAIPSIIWLIWQVIVAYKSCQINRSILLDIAKIISGLVVGCVLGSAPLLFFAYYHGFNRLFSELQGGAIAGVERLSYLAQVGQHLWSLLVLGSTVIFGIRPPWEVRWLVLPLLPFAMVFWLGALWFGIHISIKDRPLKPGRFLLVGVVMCVLLGFVMTSFGADPSGRYFIVLMMPMAIMAGEMCIWLEEKIRRWSLALVGLILIFNGIATIQCATQFPPGITTQFYKISQIDHRYNQALIQFLEMHDEKYGYTNYWVSYPLAFLSEEKLVFTPRLPYHADFRYTQRDDRYIPYDQLVEKADRAAYITTNHPALEQYLRDAFSGMNVAWQEADIGDYHIFYDLSQKVTPEQIDLGKTR
jgi:4-amino-4-deoxy-L-arabinose transferase-like glycosyltransferase